MNPLKAGLVIESGSLLEPMRRALQEMSVRVVLDQSTVGDPAAFLEKLDKARPDIVVCELAGLVEPADKIFALIKGAPGNPVVAALHTEANPNTILTAMRAGAAEYLYPPFEERLQAAVERISEERAKLHATELSAGKTLGFFSAKGGCGATTVACHVAVELQRQTPNSILLADLDIESGLVRFYMKTKSDYSVLEAAHHVDRLDHNYWRALISNGMPRLEILNAPALSASMAIPEGNSFREVVKFTRSQYDWVIADLGRSLNVLSMNVLEEIDEAFLVTTLDVPALYQAKHVLRTLLNSGYGRSRLHVIVNRMPKRPEVTLEEVEQMLGLPAYSVLPNDYVTLYEAYAEGGLLPADSVLRGYLARLAGRIAGVPEQQKKKSKFSIFSFS